MSDKDRGDMYKTIQGGGEPRDIPVLPVPLSFLTVVKCYLPYGVGSRGACVGL